MKRRLIFTFITMALFILTGHKSASRVAATDCSSIPVGGNYTVDTACTFPGIPFDGVDAGSGDTNTAKLTIGASGSLSILNGQTLLLGSLESNLGGSVTVIDGGAFQAPAPIYVTDEDSDGYPANESQNSSGSIRRNTMTEVYTVDCYDSNANAKPGQTTYYSVHRGDDSFDYDCDSEETKQYPTATYTCTACTNGSGYASTINTTAGYQTSVPSCGASGTWYAIANSTCRDPAVSSCTGSYSTSSVTQPCR